MKGRQVRPWVVVGGVVLLFALLIAPEFLVGLVVLVFLLAAGWWPAAARILRAWQPAPAAAAAFAVAVVVLIAGGHGFAGWLYRRVRTAQGNTLPPHWPWKWTLCGFGMFFCAVAAICSLVLTTHQIYWICRSPDPFLGSSMHEHVRMLQTAFTLEQTAQEAHWDSLKTREAFRTQNSPATGLDGLDVVQPIWIEGDKGELRAIVLVPRRPMYHRAARLAILQPGTNFATRRLDELRQVLESFGIAKAADPSKAKPALLP